MYNGYLGYYSKLDLFIHVFSLQLHRRATEQLHCLGAIYICTSTHSEYNLSFFSSHLSTVSIFFFVMSSHSNKQFNEYEFRLDIDIPQEVLCQSNEDNGSTDLSLNEQNRAIESHSNNSPNDTSMESKTQSSGDENDPTQDELDDDIDYDDEMPYEIVDIQPRENFPHYPIDNKIFEVHETDVDWKKEDTDSGSSSTIIDLTNPTPELFLSQLFDNRMWTIITEVMNA